VGDLERNPREGARGCRYPCTWGATILMVWVLGCPFHFIHPLGLPSIAAGASALRLVRLAAAAPRLAVLGRPSAPWPGVPAQRVPQVLVLAPCRARGLCWPPRVPAPATRLGGQAASAWVRASRASAGRWGLLGRRPVWQTASSPSGVHASSCYLVLPPDKEGRPGRVYSALSLIRAARRRWWGGCFLGCPDSWVGHTDDHCFVSRTTLFCVSLVL
jgi:hypothetical protein